MTTPSPFARSTFDDSTRLSRRVQTVGIVIGTQSKRCCAETAVGDVLYIQIEEMYSVPESFLEIEVRNPQTHGAFDIPHPPSSKQI